MSERKKQYDCDVTYGTNNELGFDYLRDNMKYWLEDMVQRGHVYAIVDEVDSILIDEARTPLIISGPLDDRSDFYNTIDAYIPTLDKTDYELDEKQRTVTLTEAGMEQMEQGLRDAGLLKSDSLYDVENISVVHHVNQALRAHKLFQRDKDYIVRNGEVVIIDEFTGRMMPGRRYSEGLHQALEAKEHQPIQPENQTLASITFQNYFRMYEKLAGMTGTAATEADEFMDIYNLEVLEIPTNMPMVRLDDDDEVYRTAEEKYRAILTLIEDCKKRGQPVLVGTTSIEKSEQLAEMLRKHGWEQHDFSDPERLRRAVFRRRGRLQGQGVRHPQRPLSRAGSLYRRAGRRAGRHHHRHQHGRPRHRHSARRQSPTCASARSWPTSTDWQRARQASARRRDPRAGRAPEGKGARRRRPLCARHRAARKPPHRQPAARPLRPPGRPRPFEVLPVARRRPDAHLRLRQARRHAAASSASRRTRRSSIPGSTRRWRRRSRRSRRATSTSARTSSSSTT